MTRAGVCQPSAHPAAAEAIPRSPHCTCGTSTRPHLPKFRRPPGAPGSDCAASDPARPGEHPAAPHDRKFPTTPTAAPEPRPHPRRGTSARPTPADAPQRARAAPESSIPSAPRNIRSSHTRRCSAAHPGRTRNLDPMHVAEHPPAPHLPKFRRPPGAPGAPGSDCAASDPARPGPARGTSGRSTRPEVPHDADRRTRTPTHRLSPRPAAWSRRRRPPRSPRPPCSGTRRPRSPARSRPPRRRRPARRRCRRPPGRYGW